MGSLLDGKPSVINIGIQAFTESVRAAGVPVAHVEWRPPGSGEPATAWILAQLVGDSDDPACAGSRVDRANQEALARLLEAQPTLVDIRQAREVWPALGRTILHAGPPISWDRMCGPMRGAIIGAILYEGWAASRDEAESLAEGGGIAFSPCHHSDAVGPMAGIISPSMPVYVVRNLAGKNTAYSNLNEGLGKVLRFGAYGPEVVERLGWMERVLAPGLRQALSTVEGGVRLKALMAQALQMGDDVHNRNVAASSLLFRMLSMALVRSNLDRRSVAEILAFLDENNHFFLNLSMAACKASLDAAHGIPGSGLVTAMSRNGVEFGIRVSGTGDQWFNAPAPNPTGLYFSGYSEADANPDLGDSAITETAGVGGFAMGTAPAMVQFIGGSPQDALAYTQEMYAITMGRQAAFALPPLSFQGTPTGIDVRKVVDSGICPVINTGIAHREAGIGQVGAGIVRAPLACFERALLALATSLGVEWGRGERA
jgi:hypothetical protein